MNAKTVKPKTGDSEGKTENEEETFPSRLFATDSLLESTRKERKALLGFSVLGVVMVWTGLIPKDITALGIRFDTMDQKALMVILAVVIFYYWITFAVLALADVLAWVHFYESSRGKGWKRIVENHPWIEQLMKPYGWLRGVVEFILPFVAGLYAIVLILKEKVF